MVYYLAWSEGTGNKKQKTKNKKKEQTEKPSLKQKTKQEKRQKIKRSQEDKKKKQNKTKKTRNAQGMQISVSKKNPNLFNHFVLQSQTRTGHGFLRKKVKYSKHSLHRTSMDHCS